MKDKYLFARLLGSELLAISKIIDKHIFTFFITILFSKYLFNASLPSLQ